MNDLLRTHARKLLATVILAGIVLTGITAAIRSAGDSSAANGKLTVAASYYPLYDFAKQVGGDKAQVTNMTPAGTEPHDYEPAARALASAQKADVFIYNGGTLEPWTKGFVADYRQQLVRASEGIALHEEAAHGAEHDDGHEAHASDPHFWLDPVLAQQIVMNIRDAFSKADPANKGYYASNAARYITKLAALDADFRTGMQQCQQDTIVTAHDAFGYLSRRYGFTVEAIAGLSPEAEPSPARLAELSDYVAQAGVKYIFFESLVSPRLADTIATETGARTLVLNPIEGLSNAEQKQGQDYLSVQRTNLANLRTARACQ